MHGTHPVTVDGGCKASAPALHRASRSVLPPLRHPSPPQVLAQLLDLFANMIRWRPDSVQTYEFFRRCAREFRQVVACIHTCAREFRQAGNNLGCMCTKGRWQRVEYTGIQASWHVHVEFTESFRVAAGTV